LFYTGFLSGRGELSFFHLSQSRGCDCALGLSKKGSGKGEVRIKDVKRKDGGGRLSK